MRATGYGAPSPGGWGAAPPQPQGGTTQAVDPAVLAAAIRPSAPPQGYGLPATAPVQPGPAVAVYAAAPAHGRAPARGVALDGERLGAHAMMSLVLSLMATVVCMVNLLALWALVTSLRAYFAVNAGDLPRAQTLSAQARTRAVFGTIGSLTFLGLIVVYYFLG